MSLVLIVEDDVMLRAQLARALHKLPDVDIVEAGTIRESIDLADGMPVDLVVTDLRLPDGTALELFPHLQRAGVRIPTVLISGCIEDYRGSLPTDITIFEKPVQVQVLRDIVSSTLGCRYRPSPFALADYLQIAGFGKHSVQIDITHDGDQVGIIVIRDGQPWTALDELGYGLDALVRMMFASELAFECSPPAALVEPRTLHGSCEQMLLEATRLIDEQRAPTIVPSRTSTQPLGSRATPSTPPPTIETRIEIATPDQEFDRLYDEGIDAVLRKRYPEAFELLSRAKAIRSTPTIEANLIRLRSLGMT
jgi:CheY-like chemotaxis protein